MSEITIHIQTPISRDDLETLVSGLELACGGNRIQVSEVFDLIVSDQRQAAALNALFALADKEQPQAFVVSKAHTNVKEHKERQAMRTWRVLNIVNQPVENISVEELNRRLAAGDFEQDTILHHPRAGRQRVIGEKGLTQVMQPC